MKKKFLNTWLFALFLYNKNIIIIKYINISIYYCIVNFYSFTINLILEHFCKLKKNYSRHMKKIKFVKKLFSAHAKNNLEMKIITCKLALKNIYNIQ